MKKIEKMTYTEIVNYCKKLKADAIGRVAKETLDFFKQNVDKPMTFKELIAIGLKGFDCSVSFGSFVFNYLSSDIKRTTKTSYAIACDENGKPLANATPFEHGELVAYYLVNDDDDYDDDDDDYDDDDEYDDDDDE